MEPAKLTPAHRVVLAEACRIADRLDRLDRQLDGEDWLALLADDESGTAITVTVDRVLAEARQQAVALKQLVSELRLAGSTSKPQSDRREVGVLGDLTARIASRRNSTTA